MPELFANGLRDSRPSVPAAKGGLRSKQRGPFSENAHSENNQAPRGCREKNIRHSPRTSFTGASRGYGCVRGVGGVMTDITNVTAARASQSDKAKPVKPSNYSRPPAAEIIRELTAMASTGAAMEFLPKENGEVSELAVAMKRLALGQADEETRAMPDAQCVQEYKPDIIKLLFSSEALALPRADYMDTQTDITPKMRMILIDWLLEVHTKYRLCPETLHLTVNLIDRYLSRKQITRKTLQLIGVTAMFIASKFEEITPPVLNDWVYITDKAYTKDDVLMMECTMLSTLNFKIVVPTAAHFFEHLAASNDCDPVHRACAQYLLELSLLDIRMLQYEPSHVVGAVMLLSNEILARSSAWPQVMFRQSYHTEQSLRPCAEELRQLWQADRAGGGGQLQAVHSKFSSAQHHLVATRIF